MNAATEQKHSGKMLLVGIVLIAANLRAPFTAMPPLLGAIRTDYALSTVATGVLTALPLLAFALMSPFSAALARRYGLERMLFCALAGIALGLMLRSAGAVWSLYAGTCIIGMGIAIGNVLLPSLVKREFSQRITSVTAFYALSMGVAAAIGSALVTPLAEVVGWQPALLWFLILPLAALVIWKRQLSRITSPTIAAAAPARERKVWQSPLAWQVTLFLGLNSTIYYVAIGWLPTILVDTGMTPARAGSLHGILQLATAVPGLILGAILSRLKDQRTIAAAVCVLSAAALLGFVLYPQQALVWAILFGLGTGAGIILGLALIGLRTADAHQAVALSGMAQCVGYLLASIGPPAIGRLHDALGGWQVPLMLCVILALVAAFMGTLAGRARVIDAYRHGQEAVRATY
ncbi:MAG: CynX/NimT family MFS transporter [Herbaspirillum sp.]|jgi:CP family cyanate transporter-like MFS transporter|uniref:MFS transporter n=1 Tax=Herbaspirillum sp. TaxID=1890675 RepID=UPI00258EC94E|nr:MFS transporter [Herbaspirillum sp.]MCP3656814.1 CynX/NimT family MFS transporter [Herbaspirillum sp.]MCP3950582.1 CynX/NimT family MFS transporter [Herbaspirillum sp.]MCP4031117.1 CynX/NimT family MFS transporter [Herbaspirillum sp.]